VAHNAVSQIRSLRVVAPAKLNLGLRVLGRRPDGYHLIESVFLPLDLEDEVSVRVEPCASASWLLELSSDPDEPSPEVPPGGENLAARAAEAFLAATGLEVEARIGLRKRIPVGAGLGGGSSDAGAVLRCLRRLFPAALAHAELLRIALELGADVPFFLDPQPALVRGIGEQIEPMKGVPALAIVLANPGAVLATAAVYEAYDALSADVSGPASSPRLGAFPAGIDSHAGLVRLSDEGFLTNDLEPAARQMCPALAGLQTRLRTSGAVATGMSGSGPTVFGVYADAPTAREALASIRSAAATSEPPVWLRLATTASALA
jgi:4-diphosphocytidyl-2-C-methyl-D-erythritol kinase